jgi:hypothetical protein
MDDDPLPSLSVGDLFVREGDSGVTMADFTVSLSIPSGLLVRTRYSTANGTAMAGSDFLTTNVVLNFSPGTTSQTATVKILGDTLTETNEIFFVSLSSPSNATIADGQAVGTIQDDDFRVAAELLGADVRITFTTIAGRTYRIELTDDLSGAILWETVPGATAVMGTGTIVEVTDTGGANKPQRFYRVTLY